jgi:opacity protein-like surface antigen
MKKNLFAAAAAVALLGSAVATNAQTVGHVGANYSRTDIDPSGVSDLDTYQLEGAVRFDAGKLAGSWTARSPTTTATTPRSPPPPT